MATTEKEPPAKKVAAPSVSQINAEYVTQVSNINRFYIIYCKDTFKQLCKSCIFIYSADYFISLYFQLANKYWAPQAKNKLPFDPKVRQRCQCKHTVVEKGDMISVFYSF